MQEPYEECITPPKSPLSPEELAEGKRRANLVCDKLNEEHIKDPSYFIKWLKESGQIGRHKGEDPKNSIQGTGNALEKENEYRKENGSSLSKNKEEYLKRLKGENSEKEE
jgi:hypothetical protein